MSNSCPRCGAKNAAGARFCNQCSTPLASSQCCPRCGQSQPITAKFCNGCGQPLTGAPPAPAPPAAAQMTGRLQTNVVIGGRYTIVRLLGRGGMGAVYLAADLRLAGKNYALKEMTDQAIADPAERQAALAAFHQEAELLAHLDHPNLPKVTDSFTEQGNQYLVMEYVQGETLEDKLAKTLGPLPEPVVRRYAEQLCDVFDYLHRRQPPVIFRDLKPANIMVQPGDRLKLIDFGIARHFKPGKSKDTQAMGTPGYAAPEQYGKGQSDARTDIYALGATLHHMLTGRDPSSDPFRFPGARSLNPLLSGSIDQIVARAVALDPNQRWQSVSDMRSAFFGQGSGTSGAALVSTMPVPTQMAARLATQTALTPVQPIQPQVPQRALPPLNAVSANLIPVPGFSNVPPGLLGCAYAGYGKRVGAFIVDAIAVYLLLIMLGVFVGSMFAIGGAGNLFGGMGLLLLLISSFFYYIWPTATCGQTIGKRMFGIKVVDDSGAAPGWGKAMMRYILGFGLENLLMYVMIGLLGWMWPLWDNKKQAWHDKIGSTYVIDK